MSAPVSADDSDANVLDVAATAAVIDLVTGGVGEWSGFGIRVHGEPMRDESIASGYVVAWYRRGPRRSALRKRPHHYEAGWATGASLGNGTSGAPRPYTAGRARCIAAIKRGYTRRREEVRYTLRGREGTSG